MMCRWTPAAFGGLAAVFAVLFLPLGAGPIRGDEPASDSAAGVPAGAARPFFDRYCVACHGPEEASGDVRFDTLSKTIRAADELAVYRKALRQLETNAMPPEDADQPPATLRRNVAKRLKRAIERAVATLDVPGAPPVNLRRLNAREYRNTIRDLFHLNTTIFDPTREFPRDQREEQIDTVGERLVTSGYLLARYLDAAEACVDRALQPAKRPPVQRWVFRDGFRQQPEIDGARKRAGGFSHLTLFEVRGADKHEGAYAPILAFRRGVPHDGFYEIRFQAESVNRRYPYDRPFIGLDPKEAFRLGIVPGNMDVGALHKPQPVEPLLAEVELTDTPKWYTVRVRLDRGYTPRFVFLNGLMDVRSMWNRLVRKYADQFPRRKNKGIVEARIYAIKYGKLPQIHIHQVEIRGPLFDRWPKSSQRALLGEQTEPILAGKPVSRAAWRGLVRSFLHRAYRRPPTDQEVGRIMRLMAQRYAQGRSPLEAYGDGLKAALCSPHFLYLDTSVKVASDDAPPRLTSHALAARLAYFLWASMPDEELLESADCDGLQNPSELARQTERLLSDPKSDAFVTGFLDSWLTLRDLGSMPPDRNRFRQYYRYDLASAMRRETFLFTRHLLDENLDIVNFLDSEFTFVNRPLARLYRIDPPPGRGFAKVKLADRRRGGLLGQASILTVTANGIDTSPVMRGVWLLDNLLGTPPSPPPANVEPLDPDVRGTKSIREQLARHRSKASCNVCHRVIDPPGFALENFDAVGQWRTKYARRVPIDASATLPGGDRFRDVVEFKRMLVEKRQGLFAQALTRKLLIYAIGRRLDASDERHVEEIVEKLESRGNGFRDLVRLVVMSELFRSGQ